MKDNDDVPAQPLPLAHLEGELLAPRLVQDEVGRVEDAEGIFMNGGAEVLGRVHRFRVTGDTGVVRHVEHAFDGEDDVILAEVVAHFAGGGFIIELEHDAGALQAADGGLIVQVKGANGLDPVVEPLDTQRFLGLPGKEVHNAAPARELAALGDNGHALVAGLVEVGEEVLHVERGADLQRPALRSEAARVRRVLIQTVGAKHQRARCVISLLMPARKHGHALGHEIGVRQRIGHALPETRVIQRGRLPDGESRVDGILRAGIGAEDPDAPAGKLAPEHFQSHGHGKGKRLRRHMLQQGRALRRGGESIRRGCDEGVQFPTFAGGAGNVRAGGLAGAFGLVRNRVQRAVVRTCPAAAKPR